jgi:hypothetical protein
MLVTAKTSRHSSRIGSTREAAQLAKAMFKYEEHGNYYFSQRDFMQYLPDGWKYLGGGVFRVAFRAPSGVVYKVANSKENDALNKKEAQIFARMAREVWIPTTTYYECDGLPIIAMPYLENDGTKLNEHGREIHDWMSRIVPDLHSGNYVVINGRPIGRDVVGYQGLNSSGRFCGECCRKHARGKHVVKVLEYA